GCGRRNAFGENAHHARVLLCIAVAADDVVVENGFDVPSLLLRHLGKVLAAVQALFFSGHGKKNDGGGKLVLAEHARAFQADRGSRAIVVGARRIAVHIKGIAVSRIIVTGHQDNALCPFWIEAGSCAESVSLVPKLTSFSMLARIRAADMSFRAAVICGSAVAGGVAFCSTSDAEASGGPANVAAIHSIGSAILEKKELLG